ncbi:lasso peptide [Scytonema hofmannii FACHB-248]|uniref:Lasso peptide n=1 Tax=Scytonema hofmannii FACHB-248 TaxID=1842502 RepID=A0ABR8GPT0_9CYAN|nr:MULTISPECIES: lasso peptide [Nostocales]MBD2605343.1 lasso peptide [Scytonema hofmannii FACHB-248]
MKSSYTAPKLTVHGNVADITQVLGNPTAQDFVFLNGNVISNSNDVDSIDLDCKGTAHNLDCVPK